MKKTLIFLSVIIFSGTSFSQLYIENGGFEQWENEGTPLSEPVEWNSFKTASGNFNNFAPLNPVATKITDAHSGQYAVRIETVQGPFGVKVNGNLTTGRINMGSTTPTSTLNHNYTITDNSDFHQAITATPDSIIFWYKYTPVGGDSAVVSSQIHNNTNYQYPENDTNAINGIAYAKKVIGTTPNWTRASAPYVYNGQEDEGNTAFVLINIASSAIPGGGEVGSVFIVDDVQLKYNELSIVEQNELPYFIYATENGIHINMKSNDRGEVIVKNLSGKTIYRESILNQKEMISPNANTGIYLVTVKSDKGQVTKKLFIQ